jgi:integrase
MPGHVRDGKHKSGPDKRRDGSTKWQARWRHPHDPTMRRERTFRTRREAEQWISAMDTDAARGAHIDPRKGDRPFAKVVEEWQATWADLAPKTRVGYQSILNRHALPRFGAQKIGAIGVEDVQRFANELAATRAPNTVRRVMDVVRGVMRVAVERRYIATNPCDAVRLPRKGTGRNIEINPLTHPELRALVAALPEYWRLPVLLDAYTGLRAGELWALRRDDVSLGYDELSVDQAVKEVTRASAGHIPEEQRLTDSLIIGQTKTYARRKVSVPAFLRDQLKEHLSSPLPGGTGPEAFIFTTPTGEPVRHNLFYKRVFAPAVRAALSGRAFRFHDLRHTCAAWLIERGASITQIKLRFGHKSITDDRHLRASVPERRARASGPARCGLPQR